MRIFICTLETRNFYFEGFGATADDASDALDRALAEHARQYNLADNWSQDMDSEIREVELTGGYRDRQFLA